MEVALFGAKDTLSNVHMNLTKIVSTSQSLMEKVPEQDRAPEAKALGESVLSKALGVRWDVSQDVLFYVNRLACSDEPVTKREILKKVSKNV